MMGMMNLENYSAEEGLGLRRMGISGGTVRIPLRGVDWE